MWIDDSFAHAVASCLSEITTSVFGRTEAILYNRVLIGSRESWYGTHVGMPLDDAELEFVTPQNKLPGLAVD